MAIAVFFTVLIFGAIFYFAIRYRKRPDEPIDAVGSPIHDHRVLENTWTVIPTIIYYNGDRLAPNHVRLRKVARYDLMVPDSSAGREFVALLEGTMLNVQLSGDFATYAWRKLLLNVVVNPVTALTLQRQSVLRRPDVHALCLEVLAEAIAVGKADGARVKEEDAVRIMETLFSYSGELGTSMYFDRLAGRHLEVEALTGAVVAAGERHGVATPLNRALLVLLRAVSDSAAGGA